MGHVNRVGRDEPPCPCPRFGSFLMHDNRLLVVNAWPTAVSDTLVPPRAAGSSLTPHCPTNLVRENEGGKPGSTSRAGAPVLVNELP